MEVVKGNSVSVSIIFNDPDCYQGQKMAIEADNKQDCQIFDIDLFIGASLIFKLHFRA